MRHLLNSLIALSLVAPVQAQEFFTLKGHGGPIMDIAVHETEAIATASFDNSVGYWRGPDPKWHEGHEAAVNIVRFWDKQGLISGSDDFTVRYWGDEAKVLGTHRGKVTGLAISQQNGLVASASWDGTIGLWSLPDPGAEPEGRFFMGHDQGVNDVAFSEDGMRLFSASVDGTIRLWDVAQGTETQQLVRHGFGINKIILNERDGWLAYGAVDGVTRIINPESGDTIADFSLDRRPILALAYDPEHARLAVGDGQGYIMVVDTETWRITRDFRATDTGPIWALAFTANGKNIHAGGIEDVMYSWPVETLDSFGGMDSTTRSFLEDPKTLPNGERQFKRKCSICHALTKGSQRKAGPTLHGLFGRRAGTVADYSYSNTLSGSAIIWTEDTIDRLFDHGPDHYIPGSKMPMQRIAGDQDRLDLIAYLREATASAD